MSMDSTELALVGHGRADAPLPAARFDHLRKLTSSIGLWEHARYTTPRVDHGYCTDDNARALTVINLHHSASSNLVDLARIYMSFLQDAALPRGGFRNRRRADGSWSDRKGSDDSQGRAIWALGMVVRFGPEDWMREAALKLFERQRFMSASPRANAIAVLGAADVLAVLPTNTRAMAAVEQWATRLRLADDPCWPWPERRLAYANARIPDGLIAVGEVLGSETITSAGLRLLDWLILTETHGDHFSFTPAGGWAPGDPRPAFDQQPIEAAAMADACSRAWRLTGATRFRDAVVRAAAWLVGANDSGAALYNAETGGCYDGLTAGGVNLNQGAESTLAGLSTLQQAHRVAHVDHTTWRTAP